MLDQQVNSSPPTNGSASVQDIVRRRLLHKHTHGYWQAIVLWAWHCFMQCHLDFIFQVSEAADASLPEIALISSVQMFRFLLFCISAKKAVLSTLQYLEGGKKSHRSKYSEYWVKALSPVLVVRFSRAPLATRTIYEESVNIQSKAFEKSSVGD